MVQPQSSIKLIPSPRHKSAWDSSRLALGAVGLLLMFAATAKGYDRLISPIVVQNAWWEIRWVQFFLVEIEFVVGFALLVGIYGVLLRFLAVSLFLIFTAYNFWLLIAGKHSCNCFGNVLSLDPLYAFGLDVVCLFILAICSHKKSAWHSESSYKSIKVIGLIISLFLGTIGFVLYAKYPHNAIFDSVNIEPSVVDFGFVKTRQTLSANITLSNNLNLPIVVTGIHSTCGCTTIRGLIGTEIQPLQTVRFPAILETRLSPGQKYWQLSVFYSSGGAYSAWKSIIVKANVTN